VRLQVCTHARRDRHRAGADRCTDHYAGGGDAGANGYCRANADADADANATGADL